VSVVTSYLELTDPAGLRASAPPDVHVEIARTEDAAVSRAMYEQVGRDWSWTDRLVWTPEQWAAWSQRVETWVASVDGARAGCYELDPQGDAVEIASFGLLPAFHGRRVGGHLLTHAVRRAFELGSRVWVHTCTLDGPHALANYEARGMRVYKLETAE
jgi:GNAT superfamily N-acetyltransferase